MDAIVKVTADQAGNVIVESANNPNYGHIRVEQTKMIIEDNGFARKKTLSALIPGTIEDLAGFGWSNGQEVRGQIVIRESLEPFNKKDPEKDLKIAGDSGVVCKHDEFPIYRKNFFTFDVNAQNELINHTNEDEIKAAYAASKQKKASAVQPNEDFNL